jgi:hypothetical protein
VDMLNKQLLKANGFKVGSPTKDGTVTAKRDFITASDIVRCTLVLPIDGKPSLTIERRTGQKKSVTINPRNEGLAVSMALDAVATLNKQ